MVKLFKYISIFLLLVILAVIGLFITAIESYPTVATRSGEQVDQAESVKKLMQQLRASVKNRTNKQNKSELSNAPIGIHWRLREYIA